MHKDDAGKVHATKHEKPTRRGAWTGAAVGALVGIIFPPAILGATLAGAAAGGGIGHALGGMSRSDAKELGEYLDAGQAALVVIGKSRVQEQLDKALTRAEKSEEREIDADGKELAKELSALPLVVGPSAVRGSVKSGRIPGSLVDVAVFLVPVRPCLV